MSKHTESSGVTYSDKKVDLFEKWVDHFGAIDAMELDLGILTAIHEWVLEGLAPRGQGCERYDMKPASAG